MSVTVDSETLQVDHMGFKTVGQVLAHIQGQKKLITHVLIDGQEPDLTNLPALRAASLMGRTLFIETSEPKAMAAEVLSNVETQFDEADRLTGEAIGLLREDQSLRAMQKLSGCFSTWQHAQESVLKVAQLLRIDLNRVEIEGRNFNQMLHDFAEQLRLIKGALENRDYVLLLDTLVYEVEQSSAAWRSAINSIRSVIGV